MKKFIGVLWVVIAFSVSAGAQAWDSPRAQCWDSFGRYGEVKSRKCCKYLWDEWDGRYKEKCQTTRISRPHHRPYWREDYGWERRDDWNRRDFLRFPPPAPPWSHHHGRGFYHSVPWGWDNR